MGHPPRGSKHGLYVVVVNAGGAPKGRERSNPRRYMGLGHGKFASLETDFGWTRRDLRLAGLLLTRCGLN